MRQPVMKGESEIDTDAANGKERVLSNSLRNESGVQREVAKKSVLQKAKREGSVQQRRSREVRRRKEKEVEMAEITSSLLAGRLGLCGVRLGRRLGLGGVGLERCRGSSRDGGGGLLLASSVATGGGRSRVAASRSGSGAARRLCAIVLREPCSSATVRNVA